METSFSKTTAMRSRAETAVLVLGLLSLLLVLWVSISHGGAWPGYNELLTSLPHPAAWLRWIVGDISEVAFYKHELASLGLLSGAYLAWWASKRGKA